MQPQGISVVIPHLNGPDDLARALAGIAREAEAAAFPVEAIVVDNGSKVLPEAQVAAHPFARLLVERTPGPGPARSTGAAAASYGVIAFLDADCVPGAGWLAAIAEAFADPETQVVGGDVRILPRQPGKLDPFEAYESVYGYRQKLYIERDHYAATLNMAVRAEIFAAVGPFAGLGIAEDMDWGQRAHAMGYRHRFVPAMRIATPARASFSELARKWDRHIADHYAERRSGMAWAAKAAALAVSPLAEIPRIVGSDRIGPASWLGAFSVLTRLRLYRTRRMLELALGADPARLTRRWREG